MTTLNGLIVDALYQTQLDRIPSEAERNHWVSVIETHGSAVFADHIVSSEEAEQLRRRRAQQVQSTSLETCEAKLAQADQYFRDLAREITTSPTEIALTACGARGLTVKQRDRLYATETIRIVGDTASLPATIQICSADELNEQPARQTIIVALLGPVKSPRNEAETCYRIQVAEQHHEQMSSMRLPANMVLGGVIELREPTRPARAPSNRAVLLKARDEESLTCSARVASTLAQANLHHFLFGQPLRCLEVLDGWDRAMGTDLARRYKAFAAPLDRHA
jgi:hypothetical protein